ncbi:hypothetical protein OG533_39595 (plasmid) [Streptomyces sp. NBC_01186]|uniref:hypothetical protein n=1 Tax=unclassified Streptomyces TaxID=2593676 RepID=UPI002DD98854|nr:MULTISPECIES: hypothetical protein [unclassified Streptomyces]WSB82015.1 hypothetical protein OHB04_40490 [Streptomyces sp. NBC_01775]WSS17990.1 hypothetical protein OG533_39595 [Streptomyces sp. NBC_01186]
MRLGITGHRGLPDRTARLVREALRAELGRRAEQGLVGLSCIADGPDSWFAEEVLGHSGSLEVIIPASTYREGLPTSHHPVYDRLIHQASDVHETGLTESNAEAHQAGSEILIGLADELLAVWDGKPARGYGGTADAVDYARRNGVPVTVVWPEGATRD